ncbi:hypothetical protein [Humidesulfovibrio sp.]
MTEIAPISKGAAFESPAQDPAAHTEPRQPMGSQLTGVQPHPIPLVPPTIEAQPVVDDNAKRLHVANMRADITGTGNLVDVIG